MIQEPNFPALSLIAVTPSDSTAFAPAVRMLYVGTAGNVTVVTEDAVTVTFANVNAGSHIGPFFVKQVKATGTTASNIVASV